MEHLYCLKQLLQKKQLDHMKENLLEKLVLHLMS